jgi:DNA-binding transcriptional ArsR family regulator
LTSRNELVTHLPVDAVAHALADPIRRDILRMLRGGPVTAGGIAGAFPVTRPATSRHLRVLREAGLVRDDLLGRERHYVLELSALSELERFLAELRAPATWARRFMALETEVYRVRRHRKRGQGAAGATEPRAQTKKQTRIKETA